MDAEQQRANQTLDLFVSVLGHDLRDPLAAVIAATGLLLQRGELNDLQKRNVLRIKSSSERMARMIADVLDFARSRAGLMQIHPAAANLHGVCRQVVDELAMAHPDREFRLELRGNPEGTWDADRLAQVISNLLANADRYSPKGKPICLLTGDTSTGVFFSVINEGPAIAQEKMNHLFDPFNQGDWATRDYHGPGLGLGLYIARSVVEAHRGVISVRSDGEKGTSFTVQLPRSSEVLAEASRSG